MADDARLEVVLEAKIDKLQASLNKANQTIGGWAAKTQKQLDDVDSRWGKLFGKTDPGRALDKVFDASRFKILDSGIARIGLFGSALEALGPAGIAAAAGIAATAIAFEQTRAATEFAANLQHAADKAHVTTDELQAFQQALRLAGGDEHAAGGALEAFSVAFGKAEAGLRRGLIPFRELFGNTFTAQSAKNLGTTAQALDAVVAAMQRLPDAQKDLVTSQLGLDGLKPLIERGPEAMRELQDEARKAGLIMDADLVKRGAAANEQFVTLTKVIDVQLKSAFVDLGPVLVGLLQQMATLAKLAADVADEFKSIETKRTSTLERLQKDFLDRAQSPLDKLIPGLQAHDLDRAAKISAELGKRADEGAAAKTPPATGSVFDQTKSAHDDSAQKTATVAAQLANAEKARLQAEVALTENIDERAAAERAIIQEELVASEARLDKLKAEINGDKGLSDAKKRDLLAALDTARWDEEQAAKARQALVDRDEIRKSFDEWLAHNEAIAAYLDQEAQAQGEIAETAAQRRQLARAALIDDQRLARIRQKEALDRAVEDKSKLPGEAKQELAAGDAARSAQLKAFDAQNADPIERYRRSVQDLNTEVQDVGVNAMHSLASGLADAIVNAKSLGDVGRAVFKQLIQDILQSVIEKNLSNTVASIFKFIPGFASGTDSAPGGLALVGENGPELVNLPRGSAVTPTSATLTALQRMSVGQRPSVTFVQPVSFDLRGAVMTDDLLRQMNSIGAQSAVAATSAARRLTAADLQRQARRRL